MLSLPVVWGGLGELLLQQVSGGRFHEPSLQGHTFVGSVRVEPAVTAEVKIRDTFCSNRIPYEISQCLYFPTYPFDVHL